MNIFEMIARADEQRLNSIWMDMLLVSSTMGENIRAKIKDRYRELEWDEFADWDALWGDCLWNVVEDLIETKSENDMIIKITRDLQKERAFVTKEEPFDEWLFSRIKQLIDRGFVTMEMCNDTMPDWMVDHWGLVDIFVERDEGLKDQYWDAKIMRARGK